MTTAMCSTVAAPIAKMFSINNDIVSKALDGLTEEQLWTQPTERNNPMLWIVGHFVQTRAELLALLGKPIDTGWGDRFVRGASLGGRAQYPPREEVQKVMTDVSRRLHEHSRHSTTTDCVNHRPSLSRVRTRSQTE
jgi:hypothetical protein